MNHAKMMLLGVALGCLSACDFVDFSIKGSIDSYNAGDYATAAKKCKEAEGREEEMARKGVVQHLVYCGLTHYHLGQRERAAEMLARGQAEYQKGNPAYLHYNIAKEMDEALADLKKNPPKK